ncbi:MAG: copper resistance protein CopC [Gemmatimonadota bacterium]|nr:MAG: copper resistance protein CopC [Gemmatimonadota bacterium]
MNTSILGRVTSITAALSCFAMLGMAASAWHLDLLDSYPKADQVLTESPDTVRFWFNQEPDIPLAGASIDGPSGRIKMGKAQETDDPKSFKVEVLEKLESGTYTVVWRAAGSDGHVIRGRFTFQLQPTAPNNTAGL